MRGKKTLLLCKVLGHNDLILIIFMTEYLLLTKVSSIKIVL